MAYVEKFQNDVFISFAHVDNRPRNDGELGWVSKFSSDLRQRIERLIGGRDHVHFWRDARLRGNVILDPLKAKPAWQGKIEKACMESALLVSISSPSYVNSDWCLNRELRKFIRNSNALYDLEVDGCSRVIRVGCMRLDETQFENTHDDELRILLKTTQGFDFYDWDRDGEREIPFRRTKEDDDDQRYWDTLADLAEAIVRTLEALKRRPVTPPPAAAPPRPATIVASTHQAPVAKGPIVFVAQVTDDLAEQRAQLVRELEDRKMWVVPRAPLPTQEPELSDTVRELIKEARVAVHPLGRYYGLVVRNEMRSIAHVQYDTVRACAGNPAGCPQVVWIPAEISDADAQLQQREFLRKVEHNSAAGISETLRVGIEELKNVIIARVAPRRLTFDPFQKALPFVYISCLPQDQRLAEQITEQLAEGSNDVLVQLATEDETVRSKHFRTNVRAADGVVVVYENGKPDWVDEQVQEARKLAQRRRRRVLRAGAVCESPPPGSVPLIFAFQDWMIIDCREGHFADDLRLFMRKLRN